MKNVLLSMVVLCALLGFCALKAHAKTSDRAQIMALEERFAAAFRAKDLDAIMKNYVPNESLFVFDVIPPRQYVGAEAYRKDWQEFLATYKRPITVELSELSITNDGELGFGHSVQRVIGTDRDGKRSDIIFRVTDDIARSTANG